ncbi:MAG TPA: type II secretion system protein GspM [Solirubrobacteraceae bacterium]
MTGRDRMVIVVVALIVAVVGVWLLVISPKRDQASKLGAQVTAAQRELSTARTQIATADADRAQYARNYQAVAELGEAVPSDDDTASLIYELQNAATRAGVDFRALQLATGSSSTSTPATTSSTKSTSQAVTATLPPGVAVGSAGLPTLPFTFTFQGNFFHLANFLGRLERFVVATNKKVSVSGRLMTLNGISFAPGPTGFPQIAATISATTYLVPASEGLTDGASPTGPAATGASAQTVSGSTSSAAPTAAITP